MTNLKAATRAFWMILVGKPHVYSDNLYQSMAGTLDTVNKQIDTLIDLGIDLASQHNLLDEAKDLLNDHK